MNKLMTEESWKAIEFFKPKEFGDWRNVAERLIFLCDKIRAVAGKPMHIRSAYATDGHTKNSYHYRGMAVDFYIEGLHVVDQFLLVSKFPDIGGIGLYDWGIHIDIGQPGRRWGRNKNGDYVALDWKYLRTFL